MKLPLRTTDGQLVVTGTTTGTHKLLAHYGLKPGNAATPQLARGMKRFPFLTLLFSAGLAPLVEEYLFRLVPSEYLNGQNQKGIQWKKGALVSVLFGLAHNIIFIRRGIGVDTKFVPVPAMISGLWYWYLIRTKSFWNTAAAHSLHNMISLWAFRFRKDI